MTHVFISYASADRAKAELLANILTSKGVSVWWDRTIPPGRIFDEVIQEALNAAGCVIVVWSHASIASNWVKTEAAEAAARGILLPAVIENVALPIEFKRIQAANLIGWNGERDHPGLDALLGAAARLMQGGTAPHGIVSVASDDSADGQKNAAAFSTSSTAPKRRRSLKLAIGPVAVSLTLAAMIYGYLQAEHAGPEEAATAPVSRGGERRDDAAPAAVRENAAPREAGAPAAPSGKHGDDAALTPVREAVPPPENTPVVGTVTLLPVAPGASSN